MDVSQFEKISKGDDLKKTRDVLGAPTEIRKNQKNSPGDVWIYDDSSGSQRGAISLDSTGQVVVGVTVVPKETENEYKLDFLLKNKFSQESFEKIPLLRCGRDFLPLQVFYISTKSGFVIEANRRSEEVESFSWTSPEYASDLAQRIKDCKR